MPLIIRQIEAVKLKDKPFKLTDSGEMICWLIIRMDRVTGVCTTLCRKAKMLAPGVYPAVTLAAVRLKRDAAKALIASGIDPAAKQKAAAVSADKLLPENVARRWYLGNLAWSPDHRESVLKSL